MGRRDRVSLDNRGYIGVILGRYRNNGKENGNDYSIIGDIYPLLLCFQATEEKAARGQPAPHNRCYRASTPNQPIPVSALYELESKLLKGVI